MEPTADHWDLQSGREELARYTHYDINDLFFSTRECKRILALLPKIEYSRFY